VPPFGDKAFASQSLVSQLLVATGGDLTVSED